MDHQYIRIDHQDGSEDVVSVADAHRAIEGSFSPSSPMKLALHNGQPVRCMFATYVLRETPATGVQPTGGQPSPEAVEEAMREDGFLPPLAADELREAETPTPNLLPGDDGHEHLH